MEITKQIQRSVNFWKDRKNQRNFLEEFATKFGIHQPNEWGKVTISDIKKGGGATFIINHHQSNVRKALAENFPDINWKREWFYRSNRMYNKDYWNNPNNSKSFLHDIANRLDIKKPEDWGKVTRQTIKEHKGRYLLEKHRGSLFLTLQSVFPGTSAT